MEDLDISFHAGQTFLSSWIAVKDIEPLDQPGHCGGSVRKVVMKPCCVVEGDVVCPGVPAVLQRVFE